MALSGFRYSTPEGTDDQAKTLVNICRLDLLTCMVQVVRRGGENNLHSHPGEDAMWFVIRGNAAFYDEHDTRFELSEGDGVVIPEGTKYWFESASEEPLEILRVAAHGVRSRSSRQDAALPNRALNSRRVAVQQLTPTQA
jgi:oxalate decarboxylase/phosphoglucose isomerase-like protein (cupin superfamily)